MNTFNDSMTRYPLLAYLNGLTLFAALFWVTGVLAQSVCDGQFVEIQPNLNRIIIDSNGTDDTDNIQCGFNLAIERNIAEIHLRDPEYFLGSVIAEDYRGTIRGSGMNKTTLRGLPDRIDCSSVDRKPALIKISGGEVVLKWLSVEGSSVCPGRPYSTGSMSLIHFTGKDKSETDCRPDIIKGEVDRVRVTALNGEPVIGISASPEGYEPGGCHDLLGGLFRMNRSAVHDASTGLHVWMRGGAQVDVTFNLFQDNGHGVNLQDTKVEARISHNDFDVNSRGIWVGNTVRRTTETRVFVISNVFRVIRNVGISLSGFSDNGRAPQQSRPVIIDNRFELTKGHGIIATSVSGGVVSGNSFNGINRYSAAVTIDEGGQASHISCAHSGVEPWRWYIGNNDFSRFTNISGPDINFGCVRNMLVGPGQNVDVDEWPFSRGDSVILDSWPNP